MIYIRALPSLLSTLVLVLCGASLVYTSQACSGLARDENGRLDLAALADEVDLYRQDIDAAATLADPSGAAKLGEVSAAVSDVVGALRLASFGGGSITDAKSAADAAIKKAKEVLDALEAEGKDVRNARAAMVLFESALRHARLGSP